MRFPCKFVRTVDGPLPKIIPGNRDVVFATGIGRPGNLALNESKA